MLLYAFDSLNHLIVAERALGGVDYICPECASKVRLRCYRNRTKHFYHLKKHTCCKRAKRKVEHLKVQLRLQEVIGKELRLERRFPSIQRIADCYWSDESIIFEIQCSPISIDEVKEREHAYQSIGLNVVWILHERCFNRARRTSVEEYLKQSPKRYYTNINEEGIGIIYDQFEWDRRGKRRKLNHKLPVCIQRIYEKPVAPLKIPACELPLYRYFSAGSFFFRGDVHSLLCQYFFEGERFFFFPTLLRLFTKDTKEERCKFFSRLFVQFSRLKNICKEVWLALLQAKSL